MDLAKKTVRWVGADTRGVSSPPPPKTPGNIPRVGGLEVNVSFYKMSDFRRVSPAGIWVLLEEHSHTIDDGRFEVMWPANEGAENWSG